ncbi:DUF1797 family protein [Lactococcus hircilactis]|uniref:DUF1797 domain-containing protein n=2 Tax=Lactococcus TaxID=1357 RepID=A0A2A5RMM5_9LACT|nr:MULTISPECIES: DUF1797 family protein [Lactococcus]MQW23606.1 DUF1797 family protein [Lactococcus sp. dk101]MQW40301.1 DUF1797 family protein [Lactococcus hircilactis]PCS00580.1 hypothetical protein RT41_GL000962 [Lactococcus fujiensis JCM 16395]TXK37706.1 DUF1797 family protein [Lactococcus sp. dk310]TXK49210.1 DUF1797 family protein [Lactococcus sp. dk322]
MKSHLLAIMNRLNRLVESGDPKETYNFEREGEIMATVSFATDEEGNGVFSIRYPKQKDAALFDDIDLVAIEIYDMIY